MTTLSDFRPYRLAINGYGRIGRCVLRAFYERNKPQPFDFVLLNDLADAASIAYLTQFDSIHGRFPGKVSGEDEMLMIDDDRLQLFRCPSPEFVDWEGMDIDLILDCSGHYTTREQAQRFLNAGARRVLFSHPMSDGKDVDATVVYGVNHDRLQGHERLLSNASCTTNCSVPVLKVLHEAIGVEYVQISTIHSAMNDQPVLDGYHQEDLRRTRSAFHMLPVSTGLARGVERLLPQLQGRVQAKAVRVPIANVSALDISMQMSRDTDETEVNALLRKAAESGPLASLLDYTEMPHASCDFNHDPHSAIVDGSQTRVSGTRLVTLWVWFDNEWAFANRMLDVAGHFLRVAKPSSKD